MAASEPSPLRDSQLDARIVRCVEFVHSYALEQGQSEADAAEASQEAGLELTRR